MSGAYGMEPPGVLRVKQAIDLCNTILDPIVLLVEGEVASFSINRGKFVFFDLKDEEEESRVGCFMMAHQLPFPLEDGMRVQVRARPGLYQKSGQFRLLVQTVEAKGEGSLKRAFELLKGKLELEGLFSPARKRALPRFPERVGIISSSGAAGFGDFMRIADGRLPGVQFILADVAVQGGDAEREITHAFTRLTTQTSVEVIVLIRGGGSIEDLHAFNSEIVARAIVASRVPVLVGVGHEKDVTIADYAADVRASTPSQAAQILLPTKEEVLADVYRLQQAGRVAVERQLVRERQAVSNRLQRMHDMMRYQLQVAQGKLESSLKHIEALSPQRVLERGYTLTRTADGAAASPSTAPGTTITTRFADGSLTSTIL